MSKTQKYVIGDGGSLYNDGSFCNLTEAIDDAKDLVESELDTGEIVTIYKLVPFKYVKLSQSVEVIDAINGVIKTK